MLQSHKSAEKDTHWNIICTNTHYATENVFFYALLLRTIYYLLICLFSIILYVIWSNLISSHSFHILSIHFYCYHCFFFLLLSVSVIKVRMAMLIRSLNSIKYSAIWKTMTTICYRIYKVMLLIEKKQGK